MQERVKCASQLIFTIQNLLRKRDTIYSKIRVSLQLFELQLCIDIIAFIMLIFIKISNSPVS